MRALPADHAIPALPFVGRHTMIRATNPDRSPTEWRA